MKPWERTYTSDYSSEPAMKREVAAQQDTPAARAREIAATTADLQRPDLDQPSKDLLQGHLTSLQQQETKYGGQPQMSAQPKPWEREFEAPAPAKPQPRGFVKSLERGGRQLAAGFGDLGSAILAPFDLGYDAVTGQPLGTSNRERRKSITEFADQGEAPGVIDSLTRAAPELIATGGPIAGVEKKVVEKLAEKGAGKALQKTVGAGSDIAVNAAQSAAQAAAEGKDPVQAAKWGAAGAAGGRVLAKTIGGTMKLGGKALTREVMPEAQRLIDEGIQPTPGQAYGGAIARGEEAAKNLPFTGSAIERAQGGVHSGLLEKQMGEALAPIGVRIEGSGVNALNASKEAIDRAYNEVVPRTFANTNDVHAAFTTVRQLLDDGAIPMLGKKERKLVGAYMDNKLAGMMDEVGHGQHIDGRLLRDLDIELGKMERDYGRKDPALGEAFRTLKENIRRAYLGADDEAIAQLQRVNTAFRNMLPVRDALEKSLGQGGTPTPVQLRKAMQKQGRAADPVIDAAVEVAPQRASRRAERGFVGGGLSLLGAIHNPMLIPLGVGVGLGGRALYSPGGVRWQMTQLRRANKLGKGLTAGAGRVNPQVGSQIGRELFG